MILKGEKYFELPIDKFVIWNFQNEYDMQYTYDSLEMLFIKEKQTNTKFYESDFELIEENKYCFINFDEIYAQAKNENMFKKYFLKYFEEKVKLNEEDFKSFTKINEILIDSITNKGMFTISKEVNRGIKNKALIDSSCIDFKNYAKLFDINTNELNNIEKCLLLINMQTLSTNKKNIIIKFSQINYDITSWINSVKEIPNIYFIFDNKNILKLDDINENITFCNIVDGETQILKIDNKFDDINLYCFANNYKIKQYKKYQNKEILKYILET